MNKPIAAKKVETVFKGRIFSVTIETVDLPKGGEFRAEVVRHPPSVVIVPITDSGDIILVRQYRHPIGRWAWELPAGSADEGENLDVAAIRECHEEIQLIPSHVEKIGAFFPTPGYCDEEMNVFRATGLREPQDHETAEPDEDEDIEVKAFSRDVLKSMIAAGEIIDLKTIAGLALL
jgi:8-oxo-dGTP pyrophosphatase MutT (NUDIX family)